MVAWRVSEFTQDWCGPQIFSSTTGSFFQQQSFLSQSIKHAVLNKWRQVQYISNIFICPFWLVKLQLALHPLYRKLVCPWMWNSGRLSKFQLDCEFSISCQQHTIRKIWYEIWRHPFWHSHILLAKIRLFFQKIQIFSVEKKFDGTYQTNKKQN